MIITEKSQRTTDAVKRKRAELDAIDAPELLTAEELDAAVESLLGDREFNPADCIGKLRGIA